MEVDVDKGNHREHARTETRTSGPIAPEKECLTAVPPDPCTIVIVEASGDLTSRKLVPALYALYRNGVMPDPFLIIGCSRTKMSFHTKTPGAQVCLLSVTMNFQYYQDDEGPSLDAYEKVLLDVMLGDHTLFWREDGVELCWSFLTPILEECETCLDREEMLYFYAAGTWGPEAAGALNETWRSHLTDTSIFSP
jgi:glucose-6-phosphate 1-dehydrogenase